MNDPAPDDMGINGEHPKDRNLSKSRGRHAFFVFWKPGLLEGHDLSRCLLDGLVNLAIGPFAYLLQFLISIHGSLLWHLSLSVSLLSRLFSFCFLCFSEKIWWIEWKRESGVGFRLFNRERAVGFLGDVPLTASFWILNFPTGARLRGKGILQLPPLCEEALQSTPLD